MKKIILGLAMLFAVPFNVMACGEGVIDINKPVIDNKLKDEIVKKTKIAEIKRINYSEEIPGYFEIFDGNNLMYVSFDSKYVLVGNLFSTENGENLTLAAMFKKEVDWDKLPFDLAIESGDLNSEKKIAVFTDPDCPVCQSFESELAQVKGVHIYTFLNPLSKIHPQSMQKSKEILCSDNPHSMYLQYARDGRQLIGNEDENKCSEKMNGLIALRDKLNFHSTPTVVNPNGIVFRGPIPAANLIQFINIKEQLINNK